MRPPQAREVSPVPNGAPNEAELKEARHVAVDALLEAEEVEARARKARRRATRLLRHYEHLLQEHLNHTIEEI